MKPCTRVFCSFLLIFLYPSLAASARQTIDKSVVTVNDEIILESDITGLKQKTQSAGFRDLFGGIDPRNLQTRQALLQFLIEEKIIDQQVAKLELSASSQEIDRHIRTIMERTGITLAQLKARLGELGTVFEEYKAGIRRQLERRNLVDREIRPMMNISDDQLRNFVMRSEGLQDARTYQLAHILVANKGTKGKSRARQILAEAKQSPERFSELAETYSDDSATAGSGGDLGQLTMDSMLTEFRKAATGTAPGQIYSDLVETPGGLHIIKVIQSQRLSFDDLPADQKAEARNQLMAQQLEKQMTLWLDRKKNESHIRLSTAETKKGR